MDELVLKHKSKNLSFLSCINVAVRLAPTPTEVILLNPDGSRASTVCKHAGHSRLRRLVVCMGKPCYLFKHRFNPPLQYTRLTTRTKKRRSRAKLTERITDYISINVRKSTLSDELHIFRTSNTAPNTHVNTTSKYYLNRSLYPINQQRTSLINTNKNIKLHTFQLSHPHSTRHGPIMRIHGVK